MSTSNKKTGNRRKSESEDEDSEHELFYYANDRMKLMKEILKLIKPKKIKQMAPDCLRDLDTEEVNAMLLEELLGISNKRLKKIFEGNNNDDESSSESDDEIDIISLDDISSDDDIGIVENDEILAKNSKRHKHRKHKPKKIKVEKDIKKEKEDTKPKKAESKKTANTGNNEKLLSVLELLELQARARAIKSQILIEAECKERAAAAAAAAADSDSEDDAVIVDTPKSAEIIIPSDSDEENSSQTNPQPSNNEVIDLDDDDLDNEPPKQKTQKIRIIRNRVITPANNLEGLKITVINDIIPRLKPDAVNRDKSRERSPRERTPDKVTEPVKEIADSQIKEELVNVSEYIGSSGGPVELIHLDTLDVDLDEINLPKVSLDLTNVIPNSSEIQIENIDDSAEQETSEKEKETKATRTFEEGEIADNNDSDNDDVLQLDTVIEDLQND